MREEACTINDLSDFADVSADDKTNIEAARTAYNGLTDDQKALVSNDTLKKLTDAEDKLVIIHVMSEVSAKTGDGMTYTGNPIQLINTPTTELPAGYTMQYAVTTENTAPADNLYTTSIPEKTEAGTYYVWYKAVGDENHNDSAVECVTVAVFDSVGALLIGHTISLDGDIGVNFYMQLTGELLAASDTAYMHFTVPDGNQTLTQDVYISQPLNRSPQPSCRRVDRIITLSRSRTGAASPRPAGRPSPCSPFRRRTGTRSARR